MKITTIMLLRISKSRKLVDPIERQRDELRLFKTSKGWDKDPVIEVMGEDVCGAQTLGRPDLRELFEVVERLHGHVRILMTTQARLSRGGAKWLDWLLCELEQRGVPNDAIWTPKGQIATEGAAHLLTTVQAMQDQGEWLETSERFRNALAYNARHQRPMRGPPFGYRRVLDESKPKGQQKDWVIDERESGHVLHVAELFATIGALNGAGARANAERVPSGKKGGVHWCNARVRDLVTFPLYRGEPYAHGATRSKNIGGEVKTVPAPAEEIIRRAYPDLRIFSPDLVARIDARLAAIKPTGGKATRSFLGVGFLACGHCGGAMVVSHSSTSGSEAYVCERQRHRACPGIGYRTIRAVDPVLLALAQDGLSGRLAAKALARAKRLLEAQSSMRGRAAELERMQDAFRTCERRVRNLRDELADTDRPAARAELREGLAAEVEKRDALRSDIEQVKSAPVPLDPARQLEQIRRRMAELADLARLGDMRARPAVTAVLGARRLRAVPSGEGRTGWRLTGGIPLDFVLKLDHRSPHSQQKAGIKAGAATVSPTAPAPTTKPV